MSQWQEEKEAAKERNEAVRRKKKEAPRRPVKPGKLAATEVVTWLENPIPVMPGSRILVHGVCSDCDPAVAALYGVKL